MQSCCSVLTCMADARAGPGREQHSVRQLRLQHGPQGTRLTWWHTRGHSLGLAYCGNLQNSVSHLVEGRDDDAHEPLVKLLVHGLGADIYM